MAIPTVGFAEGEFWFEDFTDGNISDSGIEWLFIRNHSTSSDGLQLSTNSTSPTSAAPNWPADREGWSIRTRGRLMQDHGFFGAATGPTPGRASSDDTWNAVVSNGTALLGSLGREQMSDSVETDLRPFQEDITVQLDTLDGVMRMWAWRDGEQPKEDIAPLIEEPFDLPLSGPGIWARSNDGPSSTTFSWAAFSTEHIPVNIPAKQFGASLIGVTGDCSGDGALTVDDLACVTTISDRDVVLDQLGALPGDLDGDGLIAFSDFAWLATNFGREQASYVEGNIDLNGGVDFADFTVMAANWPLEIGHWFGPGFGGPGSPAPVPEPDSCVLLLGLLAVSSNQRRLWSRRK